MFLQEELRESAKYAKSRNLNGMKKFKGEELAPLIDYKIAYDCHKSSPVYFGSQNPKGLFPHFVNDVLNKGVRSQYFGQVLCTGSGAINRSEDGGHWCQYKNAAFWAGAIDKKRPFILLTDISWYYNKNNPNITKGTCNEILWLLDNGYTAVAHHNNPEYTLFIPPKESPKYSTINTYNQNNSFDQYRVASLIRNILQQRDSQKVKNQEDINARKNNETTYERRGKRMRQ